MSVPTEQLGDELFRFATISDVHVGLDAVGMLPEVRDTELHLEPPGERCLRAALAEATAWGAQLVVAKGDLTQHGIRQEAERAAAIITAAGVPVIATRGNHEVSGRSEPHGEVYVTAGMDWVERDVRVRDVPGLRLIVFDSTIPGSHHGSYAAHAAAVLDALDGSGPALLLAHHQPQPWLLPHHWPPGVPGPDAARFLERVARANPAAWLTTGHTHRNRRYVRHGVLVTEVASTHDYPGVWAGYVVHERGLRQEVHDIGAPDARRWLDATGRTFLGIWKRWSHGRASDRVVSHAWPR